MVVGDRASHPSVPSRPEGRDRAQPAEETGFTGVELVRRVRRMPAAERVLRIALTGYGAPGDTPRAAEAGLDHHVTEPPACDAIAQRLQATG